ncbi:MAG: Uma2 family endonuclease [Acidobacteriaceae bacterium]
MATTIVSVEEYLHGDYRPDVDYVDGELEDRNLGEDDHSALQRALLFYFQPHRSEWSIRVVQEVRMRINATRYRVPDICVLSLALPKEQILTRPPLVCIEILSPEDRLRRLQARVRDYLEFGVKSVWILDPLEKSGLNCTSPHLADWKQQTEFSVEGTPIRMELAAVFANVD